MAYNPFEPPEKVLDFGALSQDEAFRYFKEALLYYPARYDEDLEDWPCISEFTVGYTIKFFNDANWSSPIDSTTTMPITRSQFYQYIDNYTISWSNGQSYNGVTPGWELYFNLFATFNTQPLYTIANPEGMTAMMLRHWGKIKSCELALFGSIGNGANLSDLSIETTGTLRNSVNNWKISDINYLRCAMIHMPFDLTITQPSAALVAPQPINVNVNESTRLLSWVYPSGYNSLSDYVVSLRGSNGFTPSSNPLYVGPEPLYVGDVQIYTKGTGYYLDSDPVYNTYFIKGSPLNIYINASVYSDSGFGYVKISTVLSHLANQDSDITLSGVVSYDSDFGEKFYNFSILIQRGVTNKEVEEFLPFLPINTYANVTSASATPSAIDGDSIIIRRNIEPPI